MTLVSLTGVAVVALWLLYVEALSGAEPGAYAGVLGTWLASKLDGWVGGTSLSFLISSILLFLWAGFSLMAECFNVLPPDHPWDGLCQIGPMSQLEAAGIVGPQNGAKKREKVEEFDYEGVEYHLMLKGEKIATLIEDGGKIHAIEIYSDKVKTADGFGLRKTAVEILAAGGTAYCDNYGFEGLLFRGMLFSVIDLTPSGQKKAETAYLEGTNQVFNESDFKSGAYPGKITLMAWYANRQ